VDATTVTLDIKEDVDLHHKAELELVCPWCHTHSIKAIVNNGTLRLKCTQCNMDAFATKIPRDKKLEDYIPRRLIF
jgi:ribosomal protein L44E